MRLGDRRQKNRPQHVIGYPRRGSTHFWRLALALAGAAVACACVAAAVLLSGLAADDSSEPKAAAIVDQLSLTFPNPAFAETATDILEEAGYTVDYYPGEAVTVDLYRDLPKHRYKLIILRAHSGIVRQINPTSEESTMTEYVAVFTGEKYSDARFGGRVEAGRIGLGVARDYQGGQYFGVTPYFIDRTMAGRFDKATIILMGCDGLRSDTTAEAFIKRGAETLIGWDGPVSASHSDTATERLLQHMLIGKLTIPEAVAHTMAELGPDPSYESTLLFRLSEG